MKLPELEELRTQYAMGELNEQNAPNDPLEFLATWLRQALELKVLEANAMSLATVGPNGQPSVRIVLLRGLDDTGLRFYTNYESRKGTELAHNQQAACLFFWTEMERQVRVEGVVAKLSPEESLAYFRSRPRESQLGAWASPQSRPIANRQWLLDELERTAQRFEQQPDLPLPPHWGGYVLQPHRLEFWQGRPNRLHDRLVYERPQPGAAWQRQRLAP